MHLSTVEKRGRVVFPSFTGERIYMEPIYNGEFPFHLYRWAGVVAAMLAGIPIPRVVYLMVDQQVVKAGTCHRRPGVHVDGYWLAQPRMHGASPGRHGAVPLPEKPSHGAFPPGHGSEPTPAESPAHHASPSRHGSDSCSWATATFKQPEGLLLASDIAACRAFTGVCDGIIGEGGNCSLVDLSKMDVVPFDAGYCYAGTVGTLHESLPVAVECTRTVVRLNIPGWVPSRN